MDITVTNETGTSSEVPADQFTYDDMPIISGISPPAGGTGGGDVVTITGTGFATVGSPGCAASDCGVSFGQSAAAAYTVSSDAQIIATSPAYGAGVVDITVTNETTSSFDIPADQFTYDATPTISGISRSAGGTAGNDVVTMTGTGFTDASRVSFGQSVAAAYTATSDTQIIATSPAHGAGVVDITVTNETGTSSDVLADKFTYDATPTISAISPSVGPTGGGTVVSVSGTGFADVTGANFNGTAAKAYTIGSDTSMSVTSPAHAAGMVNLTITNEMGTSSDVPADQFTYDAVPVISALSFNNGPPAGGTVVIITGTGFVVGSSTVMFGTVAGTSVSCTSTTSCTATSPMHSAGSAYVSVSTPGGTSNGVTADIFAWDSVPVISALSSNSGALGGGTNVAITGTGFVVGSTTVMFGTVAGSVSCTGDTNCMATSPAQGAGMVNISVTTRAGPAAPWPPTSSPTNPSRSSAPSAPTPGRPAGPPSSPSPAPASLRATPRPSSGPSQGHRSAVPAPPTARPPLRLRAPVWSDLIITTRVGPARRGRRPVHLRRRLRPDHQRHQPVGGGHGRHGRRHHHRHRLRCEPHHGQVRDRRRDIGQLYQHHQLHGHLPGQSAGQVKSPLPPRAGPAPPLAADQFTYDATPTISAISPTSGPLSGTSNVDLTGTGFADARGASLSGTAATYTISSDTSMSVTARPIAPQWWTSPSPTRRAPRATARPTTSATTPSRSSAASAGRPGARAAPTSSPSPAPASWWAPPAPSSARWRRPPSAAPAPPSCTATSRRRAPVWPTSASAPRADRQHRGRRPVHLAAAHRQCPRPEAAAARAGHGRQPQRTGLADVTEVFFNGTAATVYSIGSDSSMSATSPAGTGVVDVTVTNETSTSTTARPTSSAMTPSPPSAGSAATPVVPPASDVVTITGTGFVPGETTASFGTGPAISALCSATSCSVTVPSLLAGPIAITVSTPGGTSTDVPADQFTSDDAPTVSAVSPQLRAAGRGHPCQPRRHRLGRCHRY